MQTSVLRGEVVIFLADPSVTISVIDSQNATISGNTTGDMSVPFTISISTSSTDQVVSLAGPLGNDPFPLNMNLPAARDSSTLMTVDISIPGYEMVNPSFTLLDIDASASSTPPFSGWQDQVTFLDPIADFDFAPVDPSRYSIVDNQITAVTGPNITNSSSLANVDVSVTGSMSNISYQYGPGPSDSRGQNQRHGISSITMTGLRAVPEPGCTVTLSALLVFAMIHRRRQH